MPSEFYIPIIVKNQYTKMITEDNPSIKTVEIMKKILPNILESRIEVYNRAQSAKKMLESEKTDKNIAIVGHSAFYRHFTSILNETGSFTGEHRLNNGEYEECFL
jgi:hypothetical protein